MGIILPQVVAVNISNQSTYYENLGYKIPRYYNKKKGGYFIKKGTEINVFAEDLKPNSNIIIKVQCDICGRKEKVTNMEYRRIKSYVEKYVIVIFV